MARPKLYESTTARVKAYRERKNLKSFTVELPEELNKGLEQYLKGRDESKSAVVARLIKTQLLRRR